MKQPTTVCLQEKVDLFLALKKMNIKTICVTNSIRETATEMLISTGQYDFIDKLYSNEDVEKNKPHPDCYNHAVKELNLDPSKCIIVEDSPKGLEAAHSSVISNIWQVLNSKQVTLKNYRRYVDENFNSNGR